MCRQITAKTLRCRAAGFLAVPHALLPQGHLLCTARSLFETVVIEAVCCGSQPEAVHGKDTTRLYYRKLTGSLLLQVVPCLALFDTMKYIGSDVGTVGFGGCMGMSGFLLAVGNKVHASSTTVASGHGPLAFTYDPKRATSGSRPHIVRFLQSFQDARHLRSNSLHSPMLISGALKTVAQALQMYSEALKWTGQDCMAIPGRRS